MSDDKIQYNSHIHLPPNFSAFSTVKQAVEMAATEGLTALGAGNYYDFSVYGQFADLCRAKGIQPLFGTEIIALEPEMQKAGIRVNDPANPGKYYICGKALTRYANSTPRARELSDRIRNNDTERMREMTDKLARVFKVNGVDTGLDDKLIIQSVCTRHNCSVATVTLQERHLAQAFQEVFFELVAIDKRPAILKAVFGCDSKAADNAVGLQNEIRSYLMKAGKSCYVPEKFVNLAEAKELIKELGGIACYPVLADGSSVRCEYEAPLTEFVETLKAEKYEMVEFIPLRNSPEVLTEYVTAIDKAGIAVVAGTEHNSLEMVPLTPTCVKGQPIPDRITKIFQKGLEVLMAHQQSRG